MKIVVPMITTLFLATAIPAQAVDLKNCDDINSTRDRTECLYANMVLLNSAFQVVAKELRTAVEESKAADSGLQKQIDTLKADVDKLKASAPPDLSGVMRFGDKVQLESMVHFGTCLDHDTANAGYIHGWGCNPGQAWKLNKR